MFLIFGECERLLITLIIKKGINQFLGYVSFRETFEFIGECHVNQ